MKKFLLLLAIVGCMVLLSATSILAADVYLDTMVGGTVEAPNWFGGDGDTHDTYIGVDLPLDKLKLNLELITGHWEQDRYIDNNDFKGYDLKGGYQILNDKDLRLYLTLSGYSRRFDNFYDDRLSGILVGADAVCNLSNKVSLEGSLGVSLSGKFESNVDPDEDASLLHFKAKINYSLTKDLYASLGYRYYGFTLDEPGDPEIKAKGLTMGFGCKF